MWECFVGSVDDVHTRDTVWWCARKLKHTLQCHAYTRVCAAGGYIHVHVWMTSVQGGMSALAATQLHVVCMYIECSECTSCGVHILLYVVETFPLVVKFSPTPPSHWCVCAECLPSFPLVSVLIWFLKRELLLPASPPPHSPLFPLAGQSSPLGHESGHPELRVSCPIPQTSWLPESEDYGKLPPNALM